MRETKEEVKHASNIKIQDATPSVEKHQDAVIEKIDQPNKVAE